MHSRASVGLDGFAPKLSALLCFPNEMKSNGVMTSAPMFGDFESEVQVQVNVDAAFDGASLRSIPTCNAAQEQDLA